ncbi:hypothetical protein EV2_023461 [Malus domestica]
MTKEGPITNSYSKFSIPIHQILRDIKNEPWFKLSKQSKEDTSKLDHTTDNCYTWKNYLEKHVKEGKVDRYLDKPAAQPKRNADGDEEPLTKMIRINGIFAVSEHLGATNNSKKRKIQQALLISQVQAVDTQPVPIIGFTEQDAEGVDFPHDDALVVSVQLAHAIVDRMMVDNEVQSTYFNFQSFRRWAWKIQSYAGQRYLLDSTDTPQLLWAISHLT